MGETVKSVKINIPLTITITITRKVFFTVWLNGNSFSGNKLSDEIDARSNKITALTSQLGRHLERLRL